MSIEKSVSNLTVEGLEMSNFEVDKVYYFEDVSDPENIQQYNYRPINADSVSSKMRAIKEFGIITPLALILDSDGLIFCVDGNHRLVASLNLREKYLENSELRKSIPVTLTRIDVQINEWDSGRQTQFNSSHETIVDRALRFRKLRASRNMSNQEVAQIEGCLDKKVERTLAILHFTPLILDYIQTNHKYLTDSFLSDSARFFNKNKKKDSSKLKLLESEMLKTLAVEVERQQGKSEQRKKEAIKKNIKTNSTSSEELTRIKKDPKSIQKEIILLDSKVSASNLRERLTAADIPISIIDKVIEVLS